MSEESTAVAAAEAAPAATEAPAAEPGGQPSAPETQPEATPQQQQPDKPGQRQSPRSARRRAMAERQAQTAAAAEAARQRAMEQPREEAGATTEEGTPAGGRFKTEQTEQQAEAPAGTEEAAAEAAPSEPEGAAAEAPAPASSAEAAAEGESSAQPETVIIPLEEDHPYRSRGFTEWEAPADREQEVRGMLNAVKERAQLRQQLDDQRAQQRILEARLEAQRTGLPYQATPEQEAMLADIERAYGKEHAELLRQGLGALNEQTLWGAEEQARVSIREERVSNQFVETVKGQWDRRFPVWAEQGVSLRYLGSALTRFGHELDQQNAVRMQQGLAPLDPDVTTFFNWAASKYAADPTVQARMRTQREQQRESDREQIRAEEQQRLAEEERKRLEAAGNRHASLPPATSGVSTGASTRQTMEAGEQRPLSRRERRAALKERYGGR